jgi:hypothetical protein
MHVRVAKQFAIIGVPLLNLKGVSDRVQLLGRPLAIAYRFAFGCRW